MKKGKVIFGGLLVVAAGTAIWYGIHKRPVVRPPSIETIQASVASQNSQATALPPAAPSDLTLESNPAAWIEKRRKQMDEDRQKGLSEWRTPIEFYGKVVDERANPVAGAQIDFECNDLSPKGTSFYHTQSAADGLFSIRDINGKLLAVKVSKQGFYAYQPFGAVFYYAGQNQNFVPSEDNPVIFRLKKKGVAEALVALDKNFQISISGKPLEIDLRTGKIGPIGQAKVIMEFVKQAPVKTDERIYDWSFKITVPNGGLFLVADAFDFNAPEVGYVSSDFIEMKSSAAGNWQNRMQRQYFLKLPDGVFARIVLDLMAYNGSLKIKAFVNPSGSRNLEYDPAKAITLKP